MSDYLGTAVTMDHADIERLNAEAEQLLAISRDLLVSDKVTPANLQVERSRSIAAVARGSRYAPRFHYLQPEVDFEAVSHRADLLGRGDTETDELMRGDIEDQLSEYRAAISHDAVAITDMTSRSHGVPEPELLALAWEILDRPTDEASSPEIHSADHAAQVLRDTLQQLGFLGWSVRVDDTMHARMSVRSSEQLVRVRASARYSQAVLDRLRVHEIGTHVARYEHGNASAFRALRVPMGPNARTEEGLAVLNEHLAGLLSTTDLRRYALRVIATDTALGAPYEDVCEVLAPHVAPEVVVDIASTLR